MQTLYVIAILSQQQGDELTNLLHIVSYFIGPFEKAGKPERPIMLNVNWIAHFDLANPDPSTDECDSDWYKDTSRWQ